jgi:serine protease inhibitor
MQNQIPTQQESSGNATLEFSNGAFLAQGFQIDSAFREVVTEEFLATVQNAQFADPPAAAEKINSWVANHTHDKIQDLVSPGKEISLINRKMPICE